MKGIDRLVRRVPLDVVDQTAVFGVAMTLYAFSVRSTVTWGDSAESVAGVRALGILHAPGYPAYVLAAKVFAAALPIGPLALRVNLFSAVCAALATAICARTARSMGLTRLASAAGALCLATATSFWFYAGYAKAYAFSALVLVTIVFVAVRLGAPRAGRRGLVALGVLGALATGASYQTIATAVPGVALMIFGHRPWPRVRDLLAGFVAFAVVVAGVWGFVFVRARSDPALNWGEVRSPSRLVELVSMRDFGFPAGSGRVDVLIGAQRRRKPTAIAHRLGRVARLGARDLSWPAVVVAAGGALVLARRRPRRIGTGVLVIWACNVGAVVLVVLRGRGSASTEVVLRYGGFLFGATSAAAFAVAAAIDATARSFARTSRASRAARRRAARTGGFLPWSGRWPRWVPTAACVCVGALVVVPQGVAHREIASHSGPRFAEDYARNVFAAVPQDAVLVTWSVERGFPLLYRQIVHGERRDVAVVFMQLLTRPWYLEQMARRLGLASRVPHGDWIQNARWLIAQLLDRRLVYLDLNALYYLGRSVSYREAGLTARVVSLGPGDSGVDTEMAKTLLYHKYRAPGILSDPRRLRWPNRDMLALYAYAHVDLGAALAREGRVAEAEREFRRALRIDPDNGLARRNLDRLIALTRGGLDNP